MRPCTSIQEEMQRLFNELDQAFFTTPGAMPIRPRQQGGGSSGANQMMSVWAPPVDITESEQAIEVKAMVPGIAPEDLEIEVDNQTLQLCGETTQTHDETQGNVHRQEIMQGRFYRRIPLPQEVKGQEAQAHFENGIVTVHLPKAEQTQRHKIRIQGSGGGTKNPKQRQGQ